MKRNVCFILFSAILSFDLLTSADSPPALPPTTSQIPASGKPDPDIPTFPVKLVQVTQHPNSLEIEKQMPQTDAVTVPGAAPEPKGRPLSLQDAIAYMLDHQLALEISQLNIVYQEGNLQNAAGPFDYYFVATETYTDEHNLLNGGLKTSKKGNETITTFAATKATRIGTAFAFLAKTDKLNNPFSTPPTSNNGSISFSINQPLLQGFLTGINWMTEIATQYELYSTYYNYFQVVSQNLLNVINNYWTAVANKHILAIQEEGIRRLDQLSYNMEILIDNNELSGDQMHQVEQQIINNEQVLISAEQSLYSSIQALKLSMGDISVYDPTDEPFDLTDNFPLPPLDQKTFEKQFEDYIAYTTSHRYDIMASLLVQKQDLYLLKGAVNSTLPSVNVIGGVTDLDITMGEAGKSILSPLNMNKPQTNWNIGLYVSFPLFNDTAVGLYLEAKATYAQSILATELLKEQAIASMRQALAQQIFYKLQLQEAEANVVISKKLYEESLVKLEAGLISVFDLLSFENSLTSALVNRISARQAYMQNITQIRFLTSTMFAQSPDGCIHVLDCTTLPEMQMSESNGPLNRRLAERAQERARNRIERKEQRLKNQSCVNQK